MYFIVAASSLHHAVNDVNLNFGDNQYHIEAVPGASFIHRNVEKSGTNFGKSTIP